MSIYALRVDIAKEVYNSLKDEGVARFTWSYSKEGNLKEIESKIKKFGWENLTERLCHNKWLILTRNSV